MKDKEYFNDIKKYKNALDYLSKADLKVPNEIWAKLDLLISIRSAQQLNATRPLHTLYFSTFEKFRKHILIRTFAHNESRNQTQEIMRMIPGCNRKLVRNFFYGSMSGYNVVWEKNKRSNYSWNKLDYGYWLQYTYDFYQTPNDYLFTDLSKIKELCPDKYKYCGLDNRHNMTSHQLYMFLTKYEKHSCLEFLAKFDLLYLSDYKMAIKRLEKQDKAFNKYLIQNREVIKSIRASYNLIIKSMKEKVSLEISGLLYREFGNFKEAEELVPLELQKKVAKYLLKHRTENKIEGYLTTVYKDYLISCWKLGLELSQIDYFPKNLVEAHNLNFSRIKMKENKQTQDDLKKVAKKLSKKIHLETEDLKAIIPNTLEEFVKEGEVQHNCVARSDYINKMIKGKTCIIFVRKKENPEEPFITLELNQKTNTILQARYKMNISVEKETIDLLKLNLVNEYARV